MPLRSHRRHFVVELEDYTRMFCGCWSCVVRNRSTNKYQRLHQRLILFHRMGVSVIEHHDNPLLTHTKRIGVLLYQRRCLLATSARLSAHPSDIHAGLLILHAGVATILNVQRPERGSVRCAAAYARRSRGRNFLLARSSSNQGADRA